MLLPNSEAGKKPVKNNISDRSMIERINQAVKKMGKDNRDEKCKTQG